MPIYEYKCKKCGAVCEHIQKFSDPPMMDCGECGTSGSLEKLMSLSAFHLKGSGWYVTDYGRKGSQNNSSTSNVTSTANNTSSGANTDSSAGSGASTTSSSGSKD